MAKAAPITAANVDDTGPSAVREHHLHPLWAARSLLPLWRESLPQVSKNSRLWRHDFLFSARGSQDLFISPRHECVMHGGAAAVRDFKPICAKNTRRRREN